MSASLELVPDDRDGERALVRRAASGDELAFEKLYHAHSGRVFALCLRMSGSRQRATELTQDVFVHVWQRLDSWRGESALSSWIYRLTVNLVLSNVRGENRRLTHETPMEDETPRTESREPRAEGREPHVGDAIDLERAIAKLPAGARTVFVLHDIEGSQHNEIAGMTGTAETEEGEFHSIYGLEVMVIPTNRPTQRDDRHDLVYKTKREKYNALIQEIGRLHAMELPVLVGTVSVDVSETLSRMLKRAGIPHEVLNAKQHQREAEIVARAGQPGAVTIATNMAGRGTDIKLGPGVTAARTIRWLKEKGADLKALSTVPDPAQAVDLAEQPDDYVVEVGGLHILGSERHESRRIDRQLRGRAGRQGDPGASQFFLSLEDDLMRLFGSERIAGIMDRLGAEEGEVITHPWITGSISSAQKRVEMQHFDSRKRLLEYDDVMNQQREVVYDLRTFALEGGEELQGEVWEMIERALPPLVDEYTDAPHPEEWDLAGLRQRLMLDFFISADRLPAEDGPGEGFGTREEVKEYVLETAREAYHRKLDQFGEAAEAVQRFIVLSTIDEKWKDHLYDLDHLKASIGFRGWGQKDPLIEYKKEAYDMFEDLMRDMYASVARFAFRAQLTPAAPPPPPPPLLGTPMRGDEPVEAEYEEETPAAAQPEAPAPRPRAALGINPLAAVPPRREQLRTNREAPRPPSRPATPQAPVGRNDPCPCGSGKKYKQCHGKV
jgi:preprotein translocase subunit SecA